MLPGERTGFGDVLHGVSRTKGLRRVRAVSPGLGSGLSNKVLL